jgi:hypothetical protein
MKHKMVSVVFGCALLLAIVVSGLSSVNSVVTTSVVTTVSAHRSSVNMVQADGGTPVPPFPPCQPQQA